MLVKLPGHEVIPDEWHYASHQEVRLAVDRPIATIDKPHTMKNWQGPETGLEHKRRFVAVLGLLTALGAVCVDISLPAIPEMVRAMATDMSTGQQIVGMFLAGIALGQLPAGLVSDRIGRLPVLYTGVVIFTIAGFVCAISNSIEVMLVGRFVQGLGSSVTVVVSRAIVRDVFSGASAARLLSLMVMIFTAAPMLAPLAGGLLVNQWGWRMPFIVIAVFGTALLFAIYAVLTETRAPSREHRLLKQLKISLRIFVSQRQCILGVVMVLLPAAGSMSLVTGSAAIVIEIYKFPVETFGLLFALIGIAILVASSVNRSLLLRFNALQIVGLGCVLMGISAGQLIAFIWMEQVPFWWLWGNVCLFMFSTGFIFPNSTALALDPVPQISGAAAAIISTLQNISGALGAIIGAFMYDGTINNIALVTGLSGIATLVAYLMHKVILGDQPLCEYQEENA